MHKIVFMRYTRVPEIRGMNKDESNITVGSDDGKSFLQVSLTIAVCQAPEAHFNLQEIVSLTRTSEIVDYTFVGDWEVLNLMT